MHLDTQAAKHQDSEALLACLQLIRPLSVPIASKPKYARKQRLSFYKNQVTQKRHFRF